MSGVLVLAHDEPATLTDALAGIPYTTTGTPTVGEWLAAGVVIIDARALRHVETLSLPRRDEVNVLGDDLDDATVWDRAVRVGAQRVLFLPDAASWLAAEAVYHAA